MTRKERVQGAATSPTYPLKKIPLLNDQSTITYFPDLSLKHYQN